MTINIIKNYITKITSSIRQSFECDFIMCAVSVALLIYTSIMAAISTINYDEAYTYFKYANNWNPHFFATTYANNHPLNTFLIYLSAYFFPYNEFAIRLPNLIFLILYLIVSIKIAQKFTKYKLIVFGLLVMYWMLIPQYFSMARGYGISTALVLLFLYYFKEKEDNYSGIIRNFYILMFASYAFPGLLPVVAAVTIYYIFEIKSGLTVFLKKQYPHIIFLFINFVFVASFLMSVTSNEKPVYGSTMPFVVSVTDSYVKSFSTLIPDLSINTLYILTVLFVLAGWVTVFYKRKKAKIIYVTLISFILFFIASKLSGRPYITGRLLLPLYPLVILSFIEMFDFFTSKIGNGLFYKFLNPLLFLLLLYNYVITGNLIIKNTLEADYKISVYKNFDLNVKPTGGLNYSAAIDFYKRKFRVYPPFDKIKNIKNKLHFKVPDKLELIFLEEKSLLYFIAGHDLDVKQRFNLHIFPSEKKNIQKGREKYGFNNFDFYWAPDSKQYMYIQLPEYKIDSIMIGQKNWSQKFIINQ